MAGFALLSGCSIFNPYDSEFSCPGGYKGKCISVNGAYNEAKSGRQEPVAIDTAGSGNPDQKNENEGTEPAPARDNRTAEEVCTQYNNSDDPVNTDGACVRKKKPSALKETKELQNYNRYRSALYDKFGNLLKEPQTPVVSPPKIMRVLLMPYTGQENEFYMLRYVYFFVDEPRWLLGNSIMAEDEEE